MRNVVLVSILAVGLAFLAPGCSDGGEHDHAEHDHAGHAHDAQDAHGDHGEGHVHTAPRGGALVVLAEETAHVEVLLEPATGHLAIYVLGPHAETPVRVAHESLALTLSVAGEPHEITLPAVASELTGETVGDTSEFSADVDVLKGVESFSGTITTISARGATYSNVAITYP